MNKIYVIAPIVLCVAFVAYYMNFAKQQEVKEKQKAEAVAQAKAVEEQKKKDAEVRARADAEERTRKRLEEEAKKEAEKKAKWDEQGREITGATAEYSGEADRLAKQAAELEIQLAELRRKKEGVNREAFELQRQVELARIAKRNAEFEIQRMTDMVSNRVSNSSVAKGPSVATTP